MAIIEEINNETNGQKLLEEAHVLFETNKISEGYEVLIKAAEAGNAEAQFQLGCSIMELKYNKPLEDGIMWLTKAADQDHLFAINNLAMCYQQGEGVNVDYAMALNLLWKSADLGDMMAYYNIGQAYIFGLGVNKDILKGLGYIQKVANSNTEGCEHAQYFMGQIMEHGITEEKINIDIDQAINWYKKAADHNYRDALKALQRLKVIDGNFDAEEIAKLFMGMWLHYDMSDAEAIIGKNLKYSAFYSPKNVDYNVLIYKDQDYFFFIQDMQNSIETILANKGNIRCRLRLGDNYYCDTIQNGQMISYELFINSNKIYRINKLVIES